jgi:hypothetical protein
VAHERQFVNENQHWRARARQFRTKQNRHPPSKKRNDVISCSCLSGVEVRKKTNNAVERYAAGDLLEAHQDVEAKTNEA